MWMLAYSQRDIIKHDVEPRRSPHKVIPHKPRHILSLRNQLTRIKLRHHALQHLVHNARQHPLIVIRAQRSVDLRQRIYPWSRQHTAGDVHHLQVLGAGEGGDVTRLSADVVVDRSLEPGDLDVGAFGEDLLAYTAEAGVLDRAMATVDCVYCQYPTSLFPVYFWTIFVPLKSALLKR